MKSIKRMLFALVMVFTGLTARPALADGARLTGRGTAQMSISSGEQVSDGRMAIDFDASADARGAVLGSFRARDVEFAATLIKIDGMDLSLGGIQVDITGGEIPTREGGTYRLEGIGTLDARDRRGRPLTFDATLRVSGIVGGRGQPFTLEIGVGARGERGSAVGDGAWSAGPGVTLALSANKNHLLHGCYSGELHGEERANHYSAVMVVCFDGAGGVVSGRVSGALLQTLSVAAHTIEIVPAGSQYSVDADGLGVISLHPIQAPHPAFAGAIAVAAQGKIIKVQLREIRTGCCSDSLASVVGELVKQ